LRRRLQPAAVRLAVRRRQSRLGQPLGQATDFFNGTDGLGPTHVVPTGEILFGETALEAGDCELKFQCLGKSDASTGFFLAIDALMLKRVED